MAAFVGMICLLCQAAPATLEFFQVPGATSLAPVSVNDALDVAGYYSLADGTGHGFVRNESGKLTKFDVGALTTQPVRINASGEIAGIYSDVAGVNQGFVRLPNGAVTRFNLIVTDMNASGTVIGTTGSQAWFRTKNGIVIPLTVPGSTLVYPESINDAGQITGFYFFNGGYAGGVGGFVRAPDGTVTTFVANQGIVPLAINQGGTVTGWYAPSTGPFAPFVRQPGGGITRFHLPGTLITEGMAINAAGVIAGSYTTVDNANPEAPETATHGFLRTAQGAIVSFDAPGSTDTMLTAINSANVAAGYSQGVAGPEGFLLIPGGLF